MVGIHSAELGSRVRETRLRKGLTQQELAELIHLERTAVNKIETGGRKVAALELADIATALGVRMASFFEEPLPAVVSHRSSQGLDTVDSQIDQVLQSIADDVQLVSGLQPIQSHLPQQAWSVPHSGQEAENIADRVRGVLSLDPVDPFLSISRRAAELGLLVFSKELGVDTAEGGTILLQEGGVSLINSSNKVGRRRLAAAHELAHFLTADEYTVDWRVASDSTQTESNFDRFARALLMPRKGVSQLWSEHADRSGLRTAAVVTAGTFHVDMSTLARRLDELGIVNSSQASDVRGVRTRGADMIEHDLHPGNELEGTSQPRAFQLAVIDLVRHERISRERALDLLWHTLADDDLPQPRTRGENEIRKYVS